MLFIVLMSSVFKDSVEMEKRRVDELLMENKRLEKQKNELMNGFKKQLKLIDIYKRQQVNLADTPPQRHQRCPFSEASMESFFRGITTFDCLFIRL